MKNAVKIIQPGTAVDASILKKYKGGQKAADQRVVDILYRADMRRNESDGWFCLAMMREYFCVIPANENLNDIKPFSRIDYLSYLYNFVDCLDKHQFCQACNELGCMIDLGCTAYAGMRDVVLHILIEHPNMQYEAARKWF